MAEVEAQPGRKPASAAVAALKRRRGRPPTRPWEQFEVTSTILLIHGWQEFALGLAQQDAAAVPDAVFIKMMKQAKIPRELWDQTRAVIGRQRRYAPGLTFREEHRLAELALELNKRPGCEWDETKEDKKLAKEFARLQEKLHGRARAREMDLSLTRGQAMSSVARHITPRRLKKLWRAFDTWGAGQLGIAAVKTFRDWRRWAVAADERLPEEQQMLRSLRRREAPTAERDRAR